MDASTPLTILAAQRLGDFRPQQMLMEKVATSRISRKTPTIWLNPNAAPSERCLSLTKDGSLLALIWSRQKAEKWDGCFGFCLVTQFISTPVKVATSIP